MIDLATRHWRRGRKPVRRIQILDAGQIRKTSLALEVARTRVLVASAVFAICFVLLGLRVVDLTLISGAGENSSAGARLAESFAPHRAGIVDRNGVLLATNLPSQSLYVDPSEVLDPDDAVDALMQVLPMLDREDIARRISAPGRFAWIKRNLTPEQQYAVNRLGLPGFDFKREERRVYPQGALFGHAIGFTDVDNRGLAGLELAAEDRLLGDAAPLALSLDIRVQSVLQQSLGNAMARFGAKGAAGVVLDVETGEVLALVSLPTFDPNTGSGKPDDALFNRATLGVYELGSTFKAFTVAMALDYGTTDLTKRFDATKPIQAARFLIRDHHPEKRWLTVSEIMVHSSNIGAARMALEVGAKRQRAFLDKLGLLTPIEIELPEKARPLLPAPWNEISTMTVSFGHGIAITPLHLTSGFATLVNGGIKREPTLLKREGSVAGVQVMRPETSRAVRRLLRRVVTDGTGRNAASDGYRVGGKTGTAEKAVGGRYSRDAMITTFVGAFPIEAPRYVVLAMLDEPHGIEETHNFATAGWNVAPLVGELITRIGPILGVPGTPDFEASTGDVALREGGRVLASF